MTERRPYRHPHGQAQEQAAHGGDATLSDEKHRGGEATTQEERSREEEAMSQEERRGEGASPLQGKEAARE